MTNTSPLESIFFAALEKHTPAERMAFLNDACAGNEELRGSVDRMLAAQAGVGSFLEQPAIAGDATVLHEPVISERPGTVIGPYKLLQQIGEGGMGVVFMAEQSHPIQRTVALKIIKPGMDTRQVIARFEAERQALAMMDHPNIAKVLDAGTTDSGRPYFVMELVQGVPITKYCDEKHLSLRERLELMLPVCQAIQHAHQKGLIHRDIKPSNVLVAEYDNHAVPKVIDFGVAKAMSQKLTERTMFTEFGQVLGTMEYMSPEQSKLNQLDIDTRSDIYSLGVLIYELLTGSTPFEGKRLHAAAFDEMLRIIREEEPPKPSTRVSSSDTLPSIAANRHTEPAKLSKDVRGELDWIVMKALEKDRDRRYDSANNLAADLERYLRNETVQACPVSAIYRFRKFVRRHKFGVAASAAIAVAVFAGITGTTYGLIWALRERTAAQANAALATTQAVRSEQVAQFLKDMLKGVAPSKALGRDTTMLREIVDTTAARIDKDLGDQPEVQIELRLILGKVYFDLQLYKEMEKNARRTLELARERIGNENVAVADALGQLGQALMFLRLTDEARGSASR
jgi:eukaryotic-like serine/threonine-protein kinase